MAYSVPRTPMVAAGVIKPEVAAVVADGAADRPQPTLEQADVAALLTVHSPGEAIVVDAQPRLRLQAEMAAVGKPQHRASVRAGHDGLAGEHQGTALRGTRPSVLTHHPHLAARRLDAGRRRRPSTQRAVRRSSPQQARRGVPPEKTSRHFSLSKRPALRLLYRDAAGRLDLRARCSAFPARNWPCMAIPGQRNLSRATRGA